MNHITDYAGMLAELIFLNQSKTIVEFGVAHGDTTLSLCEAAKNTNGHVYGFDIWDTHGLLNQFPGFCTKENVEKRLSDLGYNNFTMTVLNTFDPHFFEGVKTTIGGIVDFAFIDGCHSYKGVLKDFQSIYPLLNQQTGIIAFHDTRTIDGCREFIYDLRTKYYDGTYDVVDLFGSNGKEKMGISFLIKRQLPTMKLPIVELCGSISLPHEIEQNEVDWYKQQIEINKFNCDVMKVDANLIKIKIIGRDKSFHRQHGINEW